MSVLAALRMSSTRSGVITRLMRAAAVLREPAHEALGPAVRARPLRRVAAGVVIHLLDEALLVLGREQRQISRDLQDGAVVPRGGFRALARIARSSPAASPACRRSGRPRARLLQQRRVVLLGGLERVRAHDLLARIVAIAEAPRGRSRRIVADQRNLVRAPDLLEADGRVAAVVAPVGPELAVLVEILGREDVVRQRLHARRHCAVARREDRHVVRRDAGAGVHAFALGADDDVGAQRIARAASDARSATKLAAQARSPRRESRSPARAGERAREIRMFDKLPFVGILVAALSRTAREWSRGKHSSGR